MSNALSEQVQHLLSGPVVHTKWEGDYRTPENEAFYELAFDELVRMLQPPADARALDAGCGPGYHSMRLARRGFRVESMDFSASVLEIARANIQSQGLESRIMLRQGSLLELPFPDRQFPYVLCWGVLMHVPEVARAVAELARVLAPGGALIISESNLYSWQSIGLRFAKDVLATRTQTAEVIEQPAGVEYWVTRDTGRLLTRETNPVWLVREFGRHGLRLSARRAGQFTELYTRVPTRLLKRTVHALNRLWFRWIRWPGPAFGNLFLFERPAA